MLVNRRIRQIHTEMYERYMKSFRHIFMKRRIISYKKLSVRIFYFITNNLIKYFTVLFRVETIRLFMHGDLDETWMQRRLISKFSGICSSGVWHFSTL